MLLNARLSILQVVHLNLFQGLCLGKFVMLFSLKVFQHALDLGVSGDTFVKGATKRRPRFLFFSLQAGNAVRDLVFPCLHNS